MNRSFYFVAIFLLAVTCASELTHSFLFSKLSGELFFLSAFPQWFLIVSALALLSSLLLAAYFYYKRYIVTFYCFLLSSLTTLLNSAVFYHIFTYRTMGSYYLPSLAALIVGNMIFATSLIFFTNKRLWLTLAGVWVLMLSIVLASSLIYSHFKGVPQISDTLEKINLAVSTAYHLLPLFFIVNFLSELKNTTPEHNTSRTQISFVTIIGLMGGIGFIISLIFGTMVGMQTFDSLYWKKKLAEQEKELIQRSGERAFVDNKGDSLKYLLITPKNYDPAKKYPLVVCLPYGSYQAPAAQLLLNESYRIQYPSFLLIPYCSKGMSFGGIPAVKTVDTLVFECIEALDKEFSIDADRRYVAGLSLGGYGSWHFISTRPDLFAAAVPVCGGGNPKLASKLVNVSIWAFHGEKDRNVPVSNSREMIQAIKSAGGNPLYSEFPNEEHNIWHLVERTPDLLDWLFKQKRTGK